MRGSGAVIGGVLLPSGRSSRRSLFPMERGHALLLAQIRRECEVVRDPHLAALIRVKNRSHVNFTEPVGHDEVRRGTFGVSRQLLPKRLAEGDGVDVARAPG